MQQPRIETRQSTDLNIPPDIMDDTSSTLVRSLDQDTSDIDNSSEVTFVEKLNVFLVVIISFFLQAYHYFLQASTLNIVKWKLW